MITSTLGGGAILSDEMSDVDARRDVADATDLDEVRDELVLARRSRTRASAASVALLAASSSASSSSRLSSSSEEMCWIVSDLTSSSMTAAMAAAGSVEEIVCGVAADRDNEDIETACCEDDEVKVSGVDVILKSMYLM